MIEDLFTPMHLLVIFVILFFLFGAKRLPELGKSLGHGIREFRGGIAGLSQDGGGEEPPAATPPSRSPSRRRPPPLRATRSPSRRRPPPSRARRSRRPQARRSRRPTKRPSPRRASQSSGPSPEGRTFSAGRGRPETERVAEEHRRGLVRRSRTGSPTPGRTRESRRRTAAASAS